MLPSFGSPGGSASIGGHHDCAAIIVTVVIPAAIPRHSYPRTPAGAFIKADAGGVLEVTQAENTLRSRAPVWVSVQVRPPSCDTAVPALLGSAGSRSPPPTMPCHAFTKSHRERAGTRGN